MNGLFAYHELTLDPIAFLRRNIIKNGWNVEATSLYIDEVWLSNEGLGIRGADDTYLFTGSPRRDAPKRIPGTFGVCTTYFADAAADLQALPAVQLTPTEIFGGYVLLITPALSGCTLVMQPFDETVNNPGPFMAHIQPDQGKNCLQVQNDIAQANPCFVGGGQTILYGPQTYGEEGRTNIVGVRQPNGRWIIYFQTYHQLRREILAVGEVAVLRGPE